MAVVMRKAEIRFARRQWALILAAAHDGGIAAAQWVRAACLRRLAAEGRLSQGEATVEEAAEGGSCVAHTSGAPGHRRPKRARRARRRVHLTPG